MAAPGMRSNRLFSVSVALLFSLLAGCGDQRNQPECGDVYKSRIDEHDFDVFDGGMALHRPTGLTVTQCAIGQWMSNYQCRGDSLKLSWDEAMAYAAEVSEKTGEPWRLPTKNEIPKILERKCINPAVNPFVFPDLEVANFWTASKGLHQDMFRCSFYTYQGRVFCRQARDIPQPFILVKGN
tara:strand:- start:1222 stop:1767 length:546 start_codon:yes stop_codon:yes gene_type:complete